MEFEKQIVRDYLRKKYKKILSTQLEQTGTEFLKTQAVLNFIEEMTEYLGYDINVDSKTMTADEIMIRQWRVGSGT